MRYAGEAAGYNPSTYKQAPPARRTDREEKSMTRTVAPFKAFVIRQDENRKVSAAMEPLRW